MPSGRKSPAIKEMKVDTFASYAMKQNDNVMMRALICGDEVD
jgi:hypothetical protein